MLLKPVTELSEGDRLGRDLYANDGRLMLKRGSVLHSRLIDGIKRLGEHYVYVEWAPGQAAGGEAQNRKTNLRRISKYVLKQTFDAVRNNAPLPVKAVMDWADYTASMVMEETDLAITCGNPNQDLSDLVEHSLNVCIMSIYTARALDYKPGEIKDLAVGSLLHDIGLVIPHNGLLMLNHPIIGFDLLRKNPDISPVSLQIVLQHHEQADGRGFPNGTKGEELHLSSQICGMASEFDYFMNGPLSRRLPCEGIDYLMSKIDTAFSYPAVRAFLNVFQPYPTGMKVRITGGLVGTVRKQNRGNPRRPIVKIDGSEFVFDLMEHPTFRIEEVLEAASGEDGA